MNRIVFRHAGQALMMALVAWSLPLAVAQQPATQPKTPKVTRPAPKPPTPEEKALAEERARIKQVNNAITKANIKLGQVSQSGQIAEGDKAEVGQYLDNYIDLITSPGGALEYPDARQKLRALMRKFGNAADKSGLAYVNTTLLEKLAAAATGEKYPPHGRYNCMLAIGELNAQEPTQGGTGTVTPMPQALPVLLAAVSKADMPGAVKVAALIGIQRHAKLGIADKNVERQVITELAKVVQQATPAPDTSADGHHWMRRQALEALIAIKQPGPGNEVITALAGIVNDKANPLQVRLDAMRTLGQLKVPANALGAEITPTVGGLTVDLLKNETNRRALRQGFQSLLIGLKGAPSAPGGVLTSVSGPDKKRADVLAEKIVVLAKISEVPDQATVTSQLQIELENFELWLKGEDDPAAAEAPAS